ncbi:SDR family NAD(P)-dependent oxidoreductase [Chachezhania antarctica]|uniref:SDR family NAD(P)-dependent oxidoreductase n=1 Tax=Chachezhania antarctica TaxID=2340860 RepID=UPI000EB0FB6D|nr:SDR family oxidoreductase [Chachezhania antarctica]|tara:strand:- start:1174 stop:1956 length:783 start_codon:yes stop_codon:yes gene_type:complete
MTTATGPKPLPPVPSFRMDGKVAMVTGASSGIGEGAAVALAAAGAHVVCLARRKDTLEETVTALKAAGGSAEALAVDMADLDALEAALQGRVFDVVVNSAGTARLGPAETMSAADFDAVIGLNLRAAFFLSTLCARALMAAGRPGSIVHVSSQMGHVGGVDRAVYCASKWGLEGMIRAMALDWGAKGIRVNAVAPTFVRTPLTEPTFRDPAKRAWIDANIRLDRVAEVGDVAAAILYLASDAATMVTGTSLLVDGGWTAG